MTALTLVLALQTPAAAPTCRMILSVGSLLRLEVEAVAAAAPWSHVHRHNNLLPAASTLQNTASST